MRKILNGGMLLLALLVAGSTGNAQTLNSKEREPFISQQPGGEFGQEDPSPPAPEEPVPFDTEQISIPERSDSLEFVTRYACACTFKSALYTVRNARTGKEAFSDLPSLFAKFHMLNLGSSDYGKWLFEQFLTIQKFVDATFVYKEWFTGLDDPACRPEASFRLSQCSNGQVEFAGSLLGVWKKQEHADLFEMLATVLKETLTDFAGSPTKPDDMFCVDLDWNGSCAIEKRRVPVNVGRRS